MRQLQIERWSHSSLDDGGRILQLTRDFAACSWRNVFVIVWRSRTRAEDAQQIQRLLEEFSRVHSRGYFLLTVVQDSAPPPDTEARQAIAKYLKAGAAHIVAGAVVITGGLLRVSFVRGVATGLALLARQPFPFRVCSLDDALLLFAEHGEARDVSFQANEFLAALQRLRERIDEEEPPEPSGFRAKFTLF